MTLTTRKIPLRNRAGETIAEAIVDEDDFDLNDSMGRWSLAKRGYAHRKIQVDGRQVEIKMHRFIMGLNPGDPMVDHEDRNPLNNSKANLRLCTNAQNGQNRRGKTLCSSLHRGVFWDSGVQKWRAQHSLDGKTIYIGIFLLEEDAAEAARLWREANMPFNVEPVTA